MHGAPPGAAAVLQDPAAAPSGLQTGRAVLLRPQAGAGHGPPQARAAHHPAATHPATHRHHRCRH